jgi:hypothetical protein
VSFALDVSRDRLARASSPLLLEVFASGTDVQALWAAPMSGLSNLHRIFKKVGGD